MKKAACLLAVLLLFASIILPAIPVKASPGVTVNLSQDSGKIGVSVTVSGTINSAGARVSVFWDFIRDWDGRYGKIGECWAVGNNYEVTVTIPPASRGDHYIIVRDDNNMETGYAVFTVLPEIDVSPAKAPAGALAVVEGYLINGESITAKLENGGVQKLLGSSVSDAATGFFTLSFPVPSVSPGTYFIRAYFGNDVQAEVQFEVAPPPQISLSPNSGYPNDQVSVDGVNFAPNSNAYVFFNGDLVATARVGSGGSFTTQFRVPSVNPGVYSVMAVDDFYQVPASASFRVLQKVTPGTAVIRPRSMVYYQGDVMSIYVSSEVQFQPGSEVVVKIFDAAGVPFSVHRMKASDMVLVNGKYVAPYSISVVSPAIPSDAEVGLWKWEATYYVAGDPNPKTVDGQIVVAPRASVKDILDMLSEINSRLSNIESGQSQVLMLLQDHHNLIAMKLNDLEGNIVNSFLAGFSDLSDKLATALAILNTLDSRLINIEGSLLRIESAAGTIYVRLSDINATLTEIRDGTAVISTSIGEIREDLASINAKVTGIEGGIAHVATSLGEISARLEELNATITDVVVTASGEVMAKIDTAAGQILVKLDELKAFITEVTKNARNEIIAKIDTSYGLLAAKLNALNATLVDVKNNIAVLNTKIGVLEANATAIIKALNDMNLTIKDISNATALIKAGVNEIKAAVSVLNATIERVDGSLAYMSTLLGNMSVKVDEIREFIGNTSTIVNIVKGAKDEIIAQINTRHGLINAKLNELNAAINNLLYGEGGIKAVISTSLGEMVASLNALNARVLSIEGNVANIRTVLGDMQLTLKNVEVYTYDAADVIVYKNGSVSDMVKTIKTRVDTLDKTIVSTITPVLNKVEGNVVASAEAAKQVVSGISTLMYVAVAASVAAAALAAINFLLSRRQAAS